MAKNEKVFVVTVRRIITSEITVWAKSRAEVVKKIGGDPHTFSLDTGGIDLVDETKVVSIKEDKS